jgi:hypothetical protein
VVDGREWTQPGWLAQALAWLQWQAALGGWTIQAVEQIRSWEFSCVLRVHTDQGELYFKALPRSYASEVPLLQQLARWHPAHLPQVVGADVRQRWVLLRGCPGRCLEDGAPLATWRRVARAYADVQVASAEQVDRLRELGCPDRSPSTLREGIGRLCADEAAFLVDQAHGLTAAELQRLRAAQPWLAQACEELSASNLPLSIEHGDLWASNIYVGEHSPMFIDWTDDWPSRWPRYIRHDELVASCGLTSAVVVVADGPVLRAHGARVVARRRCTVARVNSGGTRSNA